MDYKLHQYSISKSKVRNVNKHPNINQFCNDIMVSNQLILIDRSVARVGGGMKVIKFFHELIFLNIHLNIVEQYNSSMYITVVVYIYTNRFLKLKKKLIEFLQYYW